MAQLLSLNVGLPRDITWHGETVHTGIWKAPVQGRHAVRRLNIEGDGQGDLAGHGGEHRAVLVYQIDSYHYWEKYLGRNDFVMGQFGDNFTVQGLSDEEVCIGDRYRIRGALFEVTQPRVTCFRVGIRMNEPRMAALLVSHHRPGFYLRVLEEGEVGAGDEIVKVADGSQHVAVAEIDALLYLPGHPRDLLERSLRIPALSPGWKSSLQALIDQETNRRSGNSGLTNAAGPPPAWPGFRPLKVARVDRETASVVSLSFEAADRASLPAPLPGQFLVLKFQPDLGKPPVRRSYSLSGPPGSGVYRVSVKQEARGLGSAFLCNHVKAGDVLDVSAPRGSFTLRSGDRPVVLLSAGIGATPVLAMLHALALMSSRREVWWLYGTRSRHDHPFADESRALVQSLSRGHAHICYSRPRPEDRPGLEYDSPGHLGVPLLNQLEVPVQADFYLCGPPSFLASLRSALKAWGASPGRIYTEIFGSVEAVKPGVTSGPRGTPHLPPGSAGTGPQVSFTRTGLIVSWRPGWQSLLELAEACDIPAQWSCRTGVCHTCECPLISGAVTYRPDPLEPPAEGNVLVCCSQPAGDVEIDL